MEHLLPFCETERQRELLLAYLEHGTHRKAAEALGITHKAIGFAITRIKLHAALKGVAPQQQLTREVAPGFTTKRVSTAYRTDGTVALQWHIQEPEKQALEAVLAAFRESLKVELTNLHTPISAPEQCSDDLMTCYVIGDHHLAAYCWGEETGGDDYDVDISQRLLDAAVDRLVSLSPASKTGLLCNVGDFLHANDTTSTTPMSKHLLDTDGRYGRTIRLAGRLMKRMILRMLEKHEEVVIINARGNHDPDAALWLNEMLIMYFESDPRVKVLDNYNKFVWYEWGNNLIVTHHGNNIKRQQMYEAVTRNLRSEWGRCDYVYCWTGHIHHKDSQEIGGMLFESWNALPPPDAWHAASGYGADRSMTAVVLHRQYGEECRLKVGIGRLRNS